MTTLRPGPSATPRAAAHLVRLLLATGPAALGWGAAAPVAVAARRDRDAVALIRGAERLTAGALAERVRERAAELAVQHSPGTRLGVELDGGIPGLVELLAAVVAGCDVVPLGPRLAPEERAAHADPVVGAPRRGPGRVRTLSSGTTGVPRPGAGRLGIRRLLQLADLDRRIAPPDGALLVLAPPDHGHGLSAVLAGLAHGRPVVLGSGLPLEEQRALLAETPATVTGVPAQLARLDAPGAWRGVRLVVSGSSRLDAGLAERMRAEGARVLDAYGTTEAGTVALDGRPLAGCRIRLAADGAIVLRSPGARGWRHPGDRGELVEGRLRVLGRTDGRLDHGGELVDPARTAAVLRAIPGVRRVRVEAEPHELLGHVLTAELHVDPSAGLDADRIRSLAEPRLDAAHRPRRLTLR
ncbi:AMP-binding protein [Protaetiibacter intestinalis]|uniref:AMP-binding protein n=1 Tax=Protaetiibacter intestinalis TaxID=2419774 RepID=UPI001300175A|nr:class I adenylate-forming enzyme family protein [Protaetiibacter intestinalis]